MFLVGVFLRLTRTGRTGLTMTSEGMDGGGAQDGARGTFMLEQGSEAQRPGGPGPAFQLAANRFQLEICLLPSALAIA